MGRRLLTAGFVLRAQLLDVPLARLRGFACAFAPAVKTHSSHKPSNRAQGLVRSSFFMNLSDLGCLSLVLARFNKSGKSEKRDIFL